MATFASRQNLLLLLLLLSTTVQAAPLLEKEVSLRVHNRPLEEALAEINRQTGIRFSYSPQVVDVQQAVSVVLQDRPVKEVLDLLLGSQYEYKVTRKFAILRKNQITIAAAEASPEAAPSQAAADDTMCYSYITNQHRVKNFCISDSGTVAYDCLISVTIKNDEEMKRHLTGHLAAIMLASATASAQAPAPQPAGIVEQLSYVGKSFATLVAEVADQTAEAVKNAADKIGKQPAPAEQAAQPTQPVAPANSATTSDSVRPILLTIVYPFSFPDLHAERNTYHTSFNVFVGLNGGVSDFELGGLVNINRFRMSGTQLGGLLNLGFGQVSGVQLAGIGNLATKDTVKAQLAGIANLAQSAKFQIAGIANSSLHADVQVAGIANLSVGKNRTQIAGIANVADTSSCQIGLVNAAQKAGVQVGLVNVCDTTDAVLIGIVNIAHRGGLHEIEISSGLNADLNVAYRLGTPTLYTFAELSHVFADGLWRYGFGIGTQIDFARGWGMNVEGLQQTVMKNDWRSDNAINSLSQLRVLGYKRFAKHFAIFAGPAFYVYNTRVGKSNSVDLPTPNTIYSGQSSGIATKTWVGFSAGIRL